MGSIILSSVGGGRCDGICRRSGILPPRFDFCNRITIPSVGTTNSSTPRCESTTVPIGTCLSAYRVAGYDGVGGVPASGSECNDDEFTAYPNYCTFILCIDPCNRRFS